MNPRASCRWLVFWLQVGCAACSSATLRPPTEARTQVAPPAPVAQKEVTSVQPASNAADAFLVHTSAGNIELRSVHDGAGRVLATQVDSAVFDQELELIWFIEEDRLNVVDLRANSSTPIEIVRGVPDVSAFTISRDNALVSTNDGCQGPSFTLNWKATPGVEAYDRDIEDTRITGSSWLQKNLDRPARKLVSKRKFDDERRARLPRKLLDCDEASTCASTANFGTDGLELIMVRDKAGGDCWNRACLVRDPRTNRYASPPTLQSWTPAAQAKPGPCGLYYFDRAQKLYLVGSRLCTVGSTCEKLHGQALGWLSGGDIVGDIGDTGDDVEPDDE